MAVPVGPLLALRRPPRVPTEKRIGEASSSGSLPQRREVTASTMGSHKKRPRTFKGSAAYLGAATAGLDLEATESASAKYQRRRCSTVSTRSSSCARAVLVHVLIHLFKRAL